MKTLNELQDEVNNKLKQQEGKLIQLLETYIENTIKNTLINYSESEKIFIYIDDFNDFINFAYQNDNTIIINKQIILKILDKLSNINNGMKFWFSVPGLNNIWVRHLFEEDVKNIKTIKLLVAFRDIKNAENMIKNQNISILRSKAYTSHYISNMI